MNEVQGDYRENPPGMLRHMRKIDILKTFKSKFSSRMRAQFKNFPTNLPRGKIAYKATWAQAEQVDRVLKTLVSQGEGQSQRGTLTKS